MSAAAAAPPGTRRAAISAQIRARVGFWRALGEMLAISNLGSLLSYLLAWLVGSPWTELMTFPLLGLYALAAWRLGPGQGGRVRSGLRAAAWALLFGLISTLIGWEIVQIIPFSGQLYGMRIDDLRISFSEFLPNSMLLILSLFLPARILIALWEAGRERLRWQLTYSYLLVGILTTMLIPVSLGVFVAISSLAIMPVLARPGESGQRVAEALAPLMRGGTTPEQLATVLQGMLDGRTRLPIPADRMTEVDEPPNGRPTSTDGTIPTLGGVQRLSLIGPDGLVLASVGASPLAPGAALNRQEQQGVALLLAQTRGGGCTNGRPADGPLADRAACAILDERGALLATLVVESTVDSRFQWSAAIGRITSMVLVGTNVMLSISLIIIVIILLLAFGIGYMLARRLTGRLERLAAATGDVAAGKLSRRVEIDSADEVGRLGGDFNAMAARLEERERALAAEVARAEALLRANRRLVADVSHELRTPLATLRGYLEALEQEHGEHLPAHDMAVIQRETQRLTALIDDLFTLARAEAKQLPLTIESVDAAALMRRLAATLAPLARRERQVELVAALPERLPPVRADRARLEQVLLNLAQNALRHTPPGGIVAFEGRAEADGVTLSVADTGTGIPEDELALVFERFYRSDSSRARETGGAGLGLALVRELTGAMGGSVSAESTPGRGSRFNVALRRAELPGELAPALVRIQE